MNRSLLASPDPTGERERLVTGAGLWAHALTSLGPCFCLWFASILPWLWGQYLCPPQLPGTPCLKTVTSPRLCRLQSEPEKGSLSNKCWGLRSLLPDHLEQWFLNLMISNPISQQALCNTAFTIPLFICKRTLRNLKPICTHILMYKLPKVKCKRGKKNPVMCISVCKSLGTSPWRMG